MREGLCVARNSTVEWYEEEERLPEHYRLDGLSTTMPRPFEMDDSWDGAINFSVYICEVSMWIDLSERDYSKNFITIQEG